MNQSSDVKHKIATNEELDQERFLDSHEWPTFARVRIARGKHYDDQVGRLVFIAVRMADSKKGRFVYDLYIKDNLYLQGVNPLFLDFLK
jgi:hypothetical protein